MLTISVIIAAYNRSQQLSLVLDGLLEQATDGTFVFEAIVIDNNSKDATRQTVETYIPRFSSEQIRGKCLGLRYVFEPKQGKSIALNRGLHEAQGEIIAFTDDDVLVDPHWILNIMKCFNEKQCDCVGGRVVPIFPEKTPQWIRKHPVQLAGIVVISDYGEETKPYGSPMDPFIGSNYAFKRRVFNEYGFFREDLGPGARAMGEDTEIINRLESAGKSLFYCGKAIVRHPVDLSRLRLKYISQWHIALGRYAAQNEIKTGRQNFVYYFGVPRYLLKGVIQDAVLLLINLFSRIHFYNRLRSFFRKIGMILEYRSYRKL